MSKPNPESTFYNPKIPYSNDTLAFYHAPRIYEYECDGKWNECGRFYIVGDGDIVYDAEGNSTEYDSSDPNVQYYIINPVDLKGCKNKDGVLRYYKAKPLSSVKSQLVAAHLRFVGVPLKSCFQKELVTFDDVFDLFEPPGIGKIKVFPISQARCMFSYLVDKEFPCEDVWTIPSSFDDAFDRYNQINQFTDMVDSVATNPKKYGKITFKKKEKYAKDELRAIEEKKVAVASERRKEELKEIEDKIAELEETKAVMKYIELEESIDRKKNKNTEKKLDELYEKERDVRKWLKLGEKIDKLKTIPSVKIDIDDIFPVLNSARAEYTDMIFGEYIPENILEEEEEEEESFVDEEDSHEEEEEAVTSALSEEEDESMESLYDSDEDEEDGGKIVDWKKLDEYGDEDSEDDEDFEGADEDDEDEDEYSEEED